MVDLNSDTDGAPAAEPIEDGADATRAPHRWLRLALLGLILIGGVWVAKATPFGEYLTREGISEGIALLRGNPWAPAIFVSLYAVATTFAMPGSILTLAGGALFGFAWGTVWVSIGANIGASGAFWMGRKLGRQGVEAILGRGKRSSGFLARLDQVTREHGFRGLLTLRLIPVMPFNALNVGSGLTVLPWRVYAIGTLIGILPGTVIYTYFADALLSGSLEASRRAFANLLIAGVLVVALSFLPKILKRMGVRLPGQGSSAPLILVLVLLVPWAGCTEVAEAAGPIPDHSQFTAVLAEVVVDSRVDYMAVVERRAALDLYLESLANTDPTALAAATVPTQIAFWVNAYNACMLSQVADNYPIRPLRSIFGRLKNAVTDRPANSVWQIDDVFGREFCWVAGEERSQDGIEHGVIRPLGDPRIHFVVNCASVSCPPLLTKALRPETLDQQLDDAVRALLADPDHFRFDEDGAPLVEMNRVLEWYQEDFGDEAGLRQFLAPFLEAEAAARLLDPATRIQFLEYDWHLNDLPGRG